jgi:hypothetical protein
MIRCTSHFGSVLGALIDETIISPEKDVKMLQLFSRVHRIHYFALLLYLFLAGCVLDHQKAWNSPETTGLQTTPTFEELLANYNGNVNPELARNRIILRLMLLDDQYFVKYTQLLYNGRALSNTASDTIISSLTIAAAAVNPAAAAQVLTGVAAGIAAGRLAVDKNLFLSETAPAIIAKMQEARAVVDKDIQQLFGKSIADYPLE